MNESKPPGDALPRGVLAACLTPFRDDSSVDEGLLTAHALSLLERGCSALTILGTTGEANSLSRPERQRILEVLLAAGVPPSRVLLGTGCCALPETVALSRHALERGVRNLLVLPPFYYREATEDGLAAYFEGLVEALGPGEARIHLYHFPRRTGLGFGLDLLERLVTKHPESIAGIKDSGGDLVYLESCLERFPELAIYPGSERWLLEGVRRGAAGCISATTNVTSPLAGRVWSLLERGEYEEASRLHEHLVELRETFESQPLIGGLKAWIAHRDRRAGWNRVRPPLTPLPEASARPLIEKLERLEAP